MKPLLQLLIVLFAHLVSVAVSRDCKIDNTFGSACSLPKSLHLESLPNHFHVNDQNCNSLFNKNEFQQIPKVSYYSADPTANYTLVMVDPDAPNHPKGKYWLHWIEANIKGSELAKGQAKRGDTLIKYKGPGPPEHTGNHRYMFLLYRQDEGYLTNKLNEESRRLFDLSQWIKEERHSVKLCGPVAGIQFTSRY